ncbi:MAG TPA: glycosyltransferase family 1 protein [Methylomirabilota bacterium]|nr:glycosyltransferase family 1 protein [Methylomirabilota bacterium]
MSLSAAPVTTALEVALLPTLPFQAGISMQVYAADLEAALDGVPGVRARLCTPPFAEGPRPGWSRSRWIRYVGYPAWAAAQRADVYHVVDHGNAQLLWRLPRKRTVVTCHDLYPVALARGHLTVPGAPSRMRMLPTALRLLALRRAGAVLTVSHHTASECVRYLGIPASRVRVVHESVSRHFWALRDVGRARTTRAALGIGAEDIVLLHVGSDDPRKNVTAVCEVTARLRGLTSRPVHFVKVGAPFGARTHATLRRLGLGTEVVRHVGRVDDATLLRLYHAASVLVYPSFHEGFCRPVVEAMAAGLPVVASTAGAIPEVVGHAAPLFAPDDVAGMAACIADLAERPGHRRELEEREREESRRFARETHGRAVASAYRELAAA